jgi:release factor glutamine methyltransferase
MTETFIKDQLSALSSRYDAREAQQILRILFEDSFHIPWPARLDFNLTAGQQQFLAEAIQDLQAGKPIQYITGQAHFYGYVFEVKPSVLIPRPETEELVEQALKLGGLVDHRPVQVLDVGTGSGCIPITLKKERPYWQVEALDLSAEALEVARYNAARLEVEIDFRQLDFTRRELWKDLGVFDLLLSNPPYIPHVEKHLVGNNVLGQEPDIALFVPDDDPLLFYRLLADFGQAHLRAKGHLLVETNQYNAPEVAQLFVGRGYLGVEVLADLTGNNRMVRAIKA